MQRENYYPKGNDVAIEPERLLLDPINLRLMEISPEELRNIQTDLIGQQSIQEKIFKIIFEYKNFDIEGLRKSIISMGFLKHEKLVVAQYDATKYIVLEGNRRLTAVKSIKTDKSAKLSPIVSDSLETLPCLILEGEPISGNSDILLNYRKAADYYIGLRHLMSIKSWEPASRYEFQARLIESEHWSPEEVAEKFGRKKSEVIRDLKAQILFHKFKDFERENEIKHHLTYDAFAEGARSKDIILWLGWSSAENNFKDTEKLNVFFHYLIFKLGKTSSFEQDEDIDISESTQKIVRQLRDMLKLKDSDVISALEDKDFKNALMLFEDRKEGKFTQKIKNYASYINRVSLSDLEENPEDNINILNTLIKQCQRVIKILSGMAKSE